MWFVFHLFVPSFRDFSVFASYFSYDLSYIFWDLFFSLQCWINTFLIIQISIALRNTYPPSDPQTPYLSPILHLLYPQSCSSKIIYNSTSHCNIQDTPFLQKCLETGWQLMNACVGFYLILYVI